MIVTNEVVWMNYGMGWRELQNKERMLDQEIDENTGNFPVGCDIKHKVERPAIRKKGSWKMPAIVGGLTLLTAFGIYNHDAIEKKANEAIIYVSGKGQNTANGIAAFLDNPEYKNEYKGNWKTVPINGEADIWEYAKQCTGYLGGTSVQWRDDIIGYSENADYRAKKGKVRPYDTVWVPEFCKKLDVLAKK